MAATSLRIAGLLLGLFGFAQGAAADQSLAVPSFVDETRSAGIDSVYAGQWQYMVGGGVATFDCNDDGFPDMLLPGGEAKAKHDHIGPLDHAQRHRAVLRRS